LIFFFFAIFVTFMGYKNTKSWKERLDNLLLSTPVVWKVYRNYVLSNISSSMGNLIWAGVSTLKVLKLVWKSSWSYVYEKIFNVVTKRVEGWDKIVDSMREVDEEGFYFPSTYLQMLSVWERTANMETISKKIHKQYIREVEHSLENLTKWIEPLAILIASWFVLWFAFAIFGAIMKVTEVVS
jgi:type IV pilus assembly protein PilC